MAIDQVLLGLIDNQFVRPSLFKISIDDVVVGGEQQVFWVKSASLPASSVGVIEVPYHGRKVYMPGDRTFSDWQMTVIYADEDANTLYDKFLSWMNGIQTPAGVGVAREQAKTVTVDVLSPNSNISDENINIIDTYTLYGAFPIEIGSMDLSQETSDSFMEFTVSLSYSYHMMTNADDADG
jgi:hypothetical protein